MDNRDLQKARLLNSKAVSEIVEKYINKSNSAIDNPVVQFVDQNGDGRLDLEDGKILASEVYNALDVNNDGEVNVDDLKEAFNKVGSFLDFLATHLGQPSGNIEYTQFQREANVANDIETGNPDLGPVFTVSGNFSEIPKVLPELLPPAAPSIDQPLVPEKKKKRNFLKRFLFPKNVQHHYIHVLPIGPF